MAYLSEKDLQTLKDETLTSEAHKKHIMTNPTQHSEGTIARKIEEQTAKIPSDTFLWAAGGAIATSLTLKVLGCNNSALFVGQWAPTLLILGLYNKLVKQQGSDRNDVSN